MFSCKKNTITVTYYDFPSLVAIKQFTEMPYSESIQASSCSYFDSSGLMVTNFWLHISICTRWINFPPGFLNKILGLWNYGRGATNCLEASSKKLIVKRRCPLADPIANECSGGLMYDKKLNANCST